MIHDLDFAAALGLESPTKVDACGDADETVSSLSFANGAKASFAASRKGNVQKRTMILRFANCTIEIDFLERRIIKDGIERSFDDASSGDLTDPLGVNVEKFVSLVENNGIVGSGGNAGECALAMAEEIETTRNAFRDFNGGVERMSA